MAIENKNIPTFDLDHIYIIDRDDDNAERRILLEAYVKKVSISSDGNARFHFCLAGQGSSTIESDLLTIYYDISSYKASNQKVNVSYELTSSLITKLGIQNNVYDLFKANINTSQFIVPKGYVINDSSIVEAINFPDPWDFERNMTINDSNGVLTPIFSDWTHNANFKEKTEDEIYETREKAMTGHKLKVLRLTGKEDEV